MIEYAPKSGRGHGRNYLNFARFDFDVTFMIAHGGKRSMCAPHGGKSIQAAAATSILDTTLSSQVGSIVCCAAV